MAVYERITFLHILQEVRGIGKTRNQLRIIGKSPAMQRVFALVERVRDGSDSRVRGLPCAYLHEPGIRGVRGLYLPANAGITSSISCRVWSINSASLVPVGRRMNFETPAAM
jgi:hypothetical protein